jgi:hypothetical protein
VNAIPAFQSAKIIISNTSQVYQTYNSKAWRQHLEHIKPEQVKRQSQLQANSLLKPQPFIQTNGKQRIVCACQPYKFYLSY